MAKLDVRALGISCGAVWGLSLVIMAIINMVSGWGWSFMYFMGKVYVGYNATVPGCIVGFLWGFVDAGIGGVAIAWVYNKLVK